ncbi:MAG: transposase, partial [Bacteroidota bacterium]
MPGKTLYRWYRQYLSGYPEAVINGKWGKDNFIGKDKKEKIVPILKAENFGEEMAVDEKMIDEEFYTVMTNRKTGKIALLAETMRIDELSKLIDQIGDVRQKVKEITLDMSPTYERFCEQNFPQALLITDKFHVVTHIVEAVQAVRVRMKQEELSALPVKTKERKQVEKKTRLINGETRIEMLTRSRYLLFKLRNKWTDSQQKRASLLFDTFPVLRTVYGLTEQIRGWLDKTNVGKSPWEIEKQLIAWYDEADQHKIPEVQNLIRLISTHEEKIMNYFIKGKTNAKAEGMNSKIQRFITANYGVRDKDFFMYRLAKY